MASFYHAVETYGRTAETIAMQCLTWMEMGSNTPAQARYGSSNPNARSDKTSVATGTTVGQCTYRDRFRGTARIVAGTAFDVVDVAAASDLHAVGMWTTTLQAACEVRGDQAILAKELA